MQIALEAEYEEIEGTLKKAHSQLADLANDEANIEAYFETLKQVVEHPAKWLLDPQSKDGLVKAWGFVFAEPPTWTEMESRTPRLALPFRFLASSESERGRLVELLRAESNTLIEHVYLQGQR